MMESRNEHNSPSYGKQTDPPIIIVGEQEPEWNKKNNNASAASLTLGILSLILFWMPYLSIVLGAVGLIYGIISVAQHRDGERIAIAGIVSSVTGIILSIIAGFFFILSMVVA